MQAEPGERNGRTESGASKRAALLRSRSKARERGWRRSRRDPGPQRGAAGGQRPLSTTAKVTPVPRRWLPSPLRPTRGVLAEPIGQGAVEVGAEVALDAPAFAGGVAEAQPVLLAGCEGRVRHGVEVGIAHFARDDHSDRSPVITQIGGHDQLGSTLGSGRGS